MSADWFDLVPRAILRLAARRLDPAQREMLYAEEWLPELLFILRQPEGSPITRQARSMTFAGGLLIAARRLSRLQPVDLAPAEGPRFVRITFTGGAGQDLFVRQDTFPLSPAARAAFALSVIRQQWPNADLSDKEVRISYEQTLPEVIVGLAAYEPRVTG
jgi:hypothetical protein